MIAQELIDELRTELLSLTTTAVDGLMAKARIKLQQVEKKAEALKAKGLTEVVEQSQPYSQWSATTPRRIAGLPRPP